MNLAGAELRDRAVAAGRIEYLIQNVKKLKLKQRDKWPSQDYEEFVRNICIDAFFEDLKIISKEKPVVILLDAWEKCAESLQRWIVQPLLHEHCFTETERPAKLFFVVAGRQVPLFKEMLGDRLSSLVISIDKLTEWSKEHMKQFLETHGYKGIDDRVVDYICKTVNTGQEENSLDWALGVATTLQ
jgi:hypothetical protein